MKEIDTAPDRPELSIELDELCYILVKAREFDEETAPSELEDGSNASDDGELAILESGRGNPTLKELQCALEALNHDQLFDLVAMIWMGRGDFTLAEWDDARRQARDLRPQQVAAYVTGTPLVSDYLEEAMAMMGLSCEEVERNRL